MQISIKKREKISEQILAFLYSCSPKPCFTSEIAREIARDEEFVKKILIDLKGKRLVIEIRRNPQGKEYSRRQRWRISEIAFQAYKKLQDQKN